jgi:hypothetical protein
MKRVLPLAFAMLAAQSPAAEPFRHTLISAEKNVWEEAWTFNAAGLPISGCAIRKTTLHGGKQEGVDLIEVNNGVLKFVVIPTRGMSVLRVESGDLRLGWDSPVKEVVNPAHINLTSRGGLGWLEGFNEWMVRAGLESNGHPGTDKFINNVGDEATMDLTLHGKIGNIPASEVEVIVDREPPYRIRIRGRVDERMFYGPKLELWTEISTVPGSNDLRISDVVTNRGESEQEFELLYHTNFGRPLLEEGARFLAPIARIRPFNVHAAKSIADHATYAAPTPNFIEQVYCIRPLADAGGRTEVLLQNKAATRGVTMAWSLQELPYLTQWKNTPPELEGYVTGIEPGTGFPANRRIERKYGRVPKLKGGESYNATIDFAIHTTPEAVKAAAARVAKLQGDTRPIVDAEPEPKD